MSGKEQALILYDEESGDCTVVQPNEDGSYWRKIVRNKMVRMKEARRVKAAKKFMTELKGEDGEVSDVCAQRRTIGTLEAHMGGTHKRTQSALGWGGLGLLSLPFPLSLSPSLSLSLPLSLSLSLSRSIDRSQRACSLTLLRRAWTTRAGQRAVVVGPVHVDHRPGLQEERPLAPRRHDAPDGLDQDAGVNASSAPRRARRARRGRGHFLGRCSASKGTRRRGGLVDDVHGRSARFGTQDASISPLLRRGMDRASDAKVEARSSTHRVFVLL